MKEQNGMSSIARKINSGFWWKKLHIFFNIDVGILLSLAAVFTYVCVQKTPGEIELSQIRLAGHDYWNMQLLLENRVGELYSYSVREFFDLAIIPFAILLLFQVVSLINGLFYVRTIRRKMRPLNDLAIQAEQLSGMPLDITKFESLEQAISNIHVDGPEMTVSTGDKDLASIEVALNNLIHRMKESQRQQARFVSDASHELRTPISVIQGYVNMLDRWGKEDSGVLEESIEALKNESEHMKELIEQLLFLARGDSGRNTLHMTAVDLKQMMYEVWEESTMIDASHHYQLDIKEDEPACIVEGDMAMLKQSIRIFVQNAGKYSGEGDTIRLSVGKQENQVYYLVQDEGIGMQQSDVMHIFERFYRSDKARNSDTGGSGLGLSIAKWIIDAHNGRIQVVSRPEIGTRFTVLFDSAKKM